MPLASTAAALQQSAPGNTRSLSTRWPTLGKSGPRGPGLEGEDPARASKGTWHPRAALRLSQPRTGAGARSLAAKDQTLAQKWLRRFVDLISDAPAPAVREATGMEDPLQYLQGLVGGPRPPTARLRARGWAKYARWLSLRTGHSWPQRPRDVVEYLWAQVRENPVKTFPGRLLGTLSWFEKRSGLPDAQQRHSHEDKRRFEKVMADLDETGLGRKRAPSFPLVLAIALEGMVCNPSALPALRVVAWARLLNVCGALRADEIQRLAPENARLQDGGFVGNLARTKTSGAGKKVRARIG